MLPVTDPQCSAVMGSGVDEACIHPLGTWFTSFLNSVSPSVNCGDDSPQGWVWVWTEPARAVTSGALSPQQPEQPPLVGAVDTSLGSSRLESIVVCSRLFS